MNAMVPLLLLAMSALAGDASAQLYAKPVTSPEVAYEMDGYSVLPPPGTGWFELKRDRRNVYFGKKLASRTHSFITTALSAPITERFSTPEEFRDYVGKLLPQSGDKRNTVIANRLEIDEARGSYCIRYYIKTEDRRAVYATGQALLTETFGVSCLHPGNRALTIDVSYTERGRAGETSHELRAEGESFVRSLKFTSVRALQPPRETR